VGLLLSYIAVAHLGRVKVAVARGFGNNLEFMIVLAMLDF
jgi:hypothetical protein